MWITLGMTASSALTNTSNLDPRTRSLFREMARDIIARDRYARRHCLSQNTIGEIERALVKAHALGRTSTANVSTRESRSEAVVDWISIPPRSRGTLASMSDCFSQRPGTPDSQPYEIECFTENGRMRWAIVRHGVREHHSVASGSVAPLARMDLIAAIDALGTRYALTAIGIATCRDYWRRSNANDPTLPRIGMR